MEKYSGIVAYILSCGLSLVGSLTLQKTAMWVGIVCTVGTFGVNLYFRHKEDKRQEQLFREAHENEHK